MNKSDHAARADRAFFGVEGDIHDLRHMALIAWTLLQDTMKAPNSRRLRYASDEPR